eukprot:6190067-Pleurochrysis_carterae.AAC.1
MRLDKHDNNTSGYQNQGVQQGNRLDEANCGLLHLYVFHCSGPGCSGDLALSENESTEALLYGGDAAGVARAAPTRELGSERSAVLLVQFTFKPTTERTALAAPRI